MPFRWDFFKILAVGTVVVWTYCGSRLEAAAEFVKLADNMPEDNRWTPTVRWLAHNVHGLPNAGRSVSPTRSSTTSAATGRNLLGEWYPRAVWYYFPVALTIKLTLPVLAVTRRSA